MNNETKFWIGFNLISGIGRVKFSLMESHFGNLEQAWHAAPADLKESGLDPTTVQKVVDARAKISLDAEMEKLNKYDVKAITWNDEYYPPRLKEIVDRPPVLYVRGNLIPEDEWSIAVVGTRRATFYGRQVTEEIVASLAHSNVTITSGLARGIDSVAHRTALKNGGRTIAIFGCGLDTVYPGENLNLAQEIMRCGALVSEYSMGTRPRAENFPRRNRIMSGMSLGVVVVEAGERSGSLITAHQALEQNREVFAIPGSILSPMSKGTNDLIQEGAKLVRNYTDILEELNLSMTIQQPRLEETAPITDTEHQLLQHLSQEVTHIDEVCRLSGLPIATVSSVLSMMELRGLTKQVGKMNYVLGRNINYASKK